MNSNKAINVFLFTAGLIGLLAGVGLAFFPEAMHAQYDIASGNASQLSETRAPGVFLLCASVFIITGAFKSGWRYRALIFSAVVFLPYSIGRLLSLALDGMPAEGLISAMLIELLIGIVALIALRKVKPVKVS